MSHLAWAEGKPAGSPGRVHCSGHAERGVAMATSPLPPDTYVLVSCPELPGQSQSGKAAGCRLSSKTSVMLLGKAASRSLQRAIGNQVGSEEVLCH